MESFLSGAGATAVGLALTGLAWIAYNKPKSYDRLYGVLSIPISSIICYFAGRADAFDAAKATLSSNLTNPKGVALGLADASSKSWIIWVTFFVASIVLGKDQD